MIEIKAMFRRLLRNIKSGPIYTVKSVSCGTIYTMEDYDGTQHRSNYEQLFDYEFLDSNGDVTDYWHWERFRIKITNMKVSDDEVLEKFDKSPDKQTIIQVHQNGVPYGTLNKQTKTITRGGYFGPTDFTPIRYGVNENYVGWIIGWDAMPYTYANVCICEQEYKIDINDYTIVEYEPQA